MKLIVTKEELLDLCTQCAENSLNKKCDKCLFEAECNGAFVDFLRDFTEVKE